jgi:hypothetical protein
MLPSCERPQVLPVQQAPHLMLPALLVLLVQLQAAGRWLA